MKTSILLIAFTIFSQTSYATENAASEPREGEVRTESVEVFLDARSRETRSCRSWCSRGHDGMRCCTSCSDGYYRCD